MRKEKTNFDIYKQIRKDWGDIKPVTRVAPNKRAYCRKDKYPKKNWDE